MREREAHRASNRLKFHGAKGKAFGFQLRLELVLPLELNPLRPLEFKNLSRVRHSPIGKNHLPLCSLLPFRFDVHSEPVLLQSALGRSARTTTVRASCG